MANAPTASCGACWNTRAAAPASDRVNLNTLVDEALNLAYHGARARDQSFNITLERDCSEDIAHITLVPQDVTRVVPNLLSNGFYAARRRQSMEATPGFEPTLSVATRELGDAVEIRVRDNGIGIPEEVKDKLFQPFFTTKGTGLGLSISYDIVTQQHDGSITVDSTGRRQRVRDAVAAQSITRARPIVLFVHGRRDLEPRLPRQCDWGRL